MGSGSLCWVKWLKSYSSVNDKVRVEVQKKTSTADLFSYITHLCTRFWNSSGKRKSLRLIFLQCSPKYGTTLNELLSYGVIILAAVGQISCYFRVTDDDFFYF